MSALTITITGEKGGIGKTTVTAAIGAHAAAVGLRVLIVDWDVQAHQTLMNGYEKQPAVYNLLVRDFPISDCVVNVSPEIYCPAGTSPKGTLHLLPGNRETHAIPRLVGDVEELAFALDEIRDGFDLILIDTQPSAGDLVPFAYAASDYVIIPTQMEFLSLDGMINTINVIESSKRSVQLAGIIPNMYQSNTNLHDYNFQQLRQIAEERKWHLYPTVHRSIVWAEASQEQRMVYTLDRETGRARRDAQVMASAVLKHLGLTSRIPNDG